MKDLIIIGGGTAGLTAAIYAVRAGLSVLLFESDAPGGKIVNTPKIENYPGLYGVSGFDYSVALFNQVTTLGAEVIFEKIISADLIGKVKTVYSKDSKYEAKTVILANGASRKKLGCPGESEFDGKSVSYCATCDGNFFKGLDVAVIGGGETALEDAIYLSGLCNKVYVYTISDFTCGEYLLNKAGSLCNIELYTNCQLKDIKGTEKVEKISVLKDGEIQEVYVSAVFCAIGISPDNSRFKVEVNKNGYIVASEDCHTSIDGVFAAGDTRVKLLRQLVTAASDGAVAATEALKYIKKMERETV